MAWIRDGEAPKKIKVSFVVSAEEHPDLAQFILSLPYRGTSKILREILSSAVKNASTAPVVMNRPTSQQGDDSGGPAETRPQGSDPEAPRTISDGPPGADAVSDAAAGIIQNFDKMFPS